MSPRGSSFRSIYYPIFDPVTDDTIEICIPDYLQERWLEHARMQFRNLEVAQYVLDNPILIYDGIRPLDDHFHVEPMMNGRAYIGQPKFYYNTWVDTCSFPENMLYVVYTNNRNELFEHRFIKRDMSADCAPVDALERFRSQLWPKTK
jgi:hypothetical protein